MANKATEFTIRGKLHWAKVVGAAKAHTGEPKYDKGPKWSVDITPDAKSTALLKQHGLAEKLRKDKPTAKNPRKEAFVSLTMLENKADGTKNNPPSIIDASGRAWGNEEIGNDTIADILVRFVDYGTTKGLYFKKMRVLKHVPYEGGADFEPLSEDDEFFGSTETASTGEATESSAFDPDLDDDVPF